MSTPPQDTAALTTGSEPELKEWVVGDLAEIKYKVSGRGFVWKLRFTDANINKSLHELIGDMRRGIPWDVENEHPPRCEYFFEGAVAGIAEYALVRALKDRNLCFSFLPPVPRIKDRIPSSYYHYHGPTYY